MNAISRAPIVALLSAVPALAWAQFVVVSEDGAVTTSSTAHTPSGATGSTSVALSSRFSYGSRLDLQSDPTASSVVSDDNISIFAAAQWSPVSTDFSAPSGGASRASMTLSFSVLKDTPVLFDLYRSMDAGVSSSMSFMLTGPNGSLLPALLPRGNGVGAELYTTLTAGTYTMSVSGSLSRPPANMPAPYAYMMGQIKVSAVPELSTSMLMALGLSGILGVASRRRRQA